MKRPEGPTVYKAQADGLGKDETGTEGPKVRPFANNSKPRPSAPAAWASPTAGLWPFGGVLPATKRQGASGPAELN